MEPLLDRRVVCDEMEQARKTFHGLLDSARDTDLRLPSNGTRWNNEELLFHMLFGYLVVRALLLLMRLFGRLPDGFSMLFARVLNAASKPFHVINYLASCAGARVFGRARMSREFDRVIDALQRCLQHESGTELRRGMHYPTSWDPFFKDYMTLADLYRYPTQHFDFHRRQLTPNEK